MRNILVLVSVLCCSSGAIAGPGCQAGHLSRACDYIIKCFGDPLYGGPLQEAAKHGDGNGVGVDGAACGHRIAGVTYWDEMTGGCDNGNMRLAGLAGWDAFQKRKSKCAPIEQWRH
jgi:hypothetical protein